MWSFFINKNIFGYGMYLGTIFNILEIFNISNKERTQLKQHEQKLNNFY
jgi:hypothetical protein